MTTLSKLISLIFLMFSIHLFAGNDPLVMNKNGFMIDGKATIIRGGSVQWFRLPEEVWEDRLKKFKAAGFNTVGMYIAWNQIEQEKGVFNFEQPNIRHFLELAQKLGLYVAVRPGPYITNEMDGGGLPAWLTKDSTKKSFDKDGRANLRSHDPDFIEPVSRYFEALNEVLRPYLITNGGPIVLYAIENEYTWFERAFGLDKIFIEGWGFERPIGQKLPTKPYFEALLHITQETGIDVPVVSCPGDGRASAMGDVEGVVPFPSMYEWANPGQPDQIAHDLLVDMHDPEKHDGAYLNVPAGSLEVNRSPTEFRRLIAGGLDGVFGFNMAGIIQEGYMNSLTLAARAFDVPPHWGPNEERADPWLNTIFKFDKIERIQTAFVSPDLGYFNNVIDYHGAISPSGVMRDIFYQFRRDNLSYDLVQEYIGQLERPNVSGSAGQDLRLEIDNGLIGSRIDDGMAHYWFENGEFSMIQLVNQSGKDQILKSGSIKFKGQSYPKYSSLNISNAREPKLTYAHNMMFNLPINGATTLAHSTSEVLTVRDFNGDKLLVLYGVKGSVGELELHLEGTLKPVYMHQDFELVKNANSHLALRYQHGEVSQAIFEDADGERLRVIITNRFLAGRLWFEELDNNTVLLAGPGYVEADQGGALEYQYDHRRTPITVISPEKGTLQGLAAINDYSVLNQQQTFEVGEKKSLSQLPSLADGKAFSDRAESLPDFDDSSWTQWSGQPKNLEELGIFKGHAWYRSKFNVDLKKNRRLEKLYVESASDIVGIYVNGNYVSTVSPLGTEINNLSWNSQYSFEGIKKYLHDGENTIVFRTEIWGHGSFMFGRGTIIGSKARIPALGYEGVKGLLGKAKVGNINLTNWSVRTDLGGERSGFGEASLDDSKWTDRTIPLQLDKGDILWYRTRFSINDLPSEDDVVAPIVLQLKGLRTKGTIFVNGRLMGRWLSDSDWLGRGTWVSVQRAMWVTLEADHYPIPRELLFKDGRENVISIAFEDASHSSENAGEVFDLSLQYNEEQYIWEAGEVIRETGASFKGRFSLGFIQKLKAD